MSFLINPHAFGGASFSPDQISGLTFWIDPDNAGTVTLSGSDYDTIADQASPDHGLTTVSPSVSRPAQVTSGGREWMQLVFANRDSMVTSGKTDSSYQHGSSSFAIFVVVKTTSSTTNKVVLQKGGSAARYRISINASASGDVRGVISDGTNTVTITSPAVSINDGNPHLIALIRNNTSSHVRVMVDGVDVTGSPASVGSVGNIDESSFQLMVGASPSASTTANEWDGEIGEILMYHHELTSGELADVLAYYQSKWGVA